MLDGLTRLVVRRPWTVILLTLVAAAALGAGMGSLGTDTDVTRDLPQRVADAVKVYLGAVGFVGRDDDSPFGRQREASRAFLEVEHSF